MKEIPMKSLWASLILCVATSASYGQGFDYIGPSNNPYTTGNACSFSGNVTNQGWWWSVGQPYTSGTQIIASELWCAATNRAQFRSISQWKVRIWDSTAAFAANPRLGNVLDATLFQMLGDTSVAFSAGCRTYPVNAPGPAFKIGFDIPDTLIPANQEYVYGIAPDCLYTFGDMTWIGVQESNAPNAALGWGAWYQGPTGVQQGAPLAFQLVTSDFVTDLGGGCGPTAGSEPLLQSSRARLGNRWSLNGSQFTNNATVLIFASAGNSSPIPLLPPCEVHLNLRMSGASNMILVVQADGSGQFGMSFNLPNQAHLEGGVFQTQCLAGLISGWIYPFEMSNGVRLVMTF